MPCLALLALIAWGPSLADAFGFSVGKAVQCGDLSITWEGGTPPFTLLLTPPFGTPRNIPIPPSAYNNGQGSYSVKLTNLNQSDPFVLTMSDATSFNAGGTSGLIETGPAEGQSCDTGDPGTDFLFQTPATLQQCRPFTFTAYTSAQLPITVYGLIPGGQAFTFTIPPGSSQYQWPARLHAGTSVIFAMVDRTGRHGGATDVLTVGRSDDNTCLVGAVPSTTIVTGTPSGSPTTSGSSSPSSSEPVNPAPGRSTAAIAGGVAGILVLAGVIVAGVVFCFRHRRMTRNTNTTPSIGHRRNRTSQRIRSDFDLVGDKLDPFTGRPTDGHFSRSGQRTDLPPGHQPDPFVLSPLPPASQYQFPSRNGDVESSPNYPYNQPYIPTTSNMGEGSRHVESISSNPFDPPFSPPSGSMTATDRKRAQAGVPLYTPSRFILHNDFEDEPVGPDGVVELPPQYSDRRPTRNPFDSSSNQATPSHSTPTLHLHSQDPNAEDERHLAPQR